MYLEKLQDFWQSLPSGKANAEFKRAIKQRLSCDDSPVSGLLDRVMFQAEREKAKELKRGRYKIRRFVNGRVKKVFSDGSQDVIVNAAKAAANQAAIDLDKKLYINGYFGKLVLSWPDEKIKQWAEDIANNFRAHGWSGDDEEDKLFIDTVCRSYGFDRVSFEDDLYGWRLPTFGRLSDAGYWRRKARRLQARTIDHAARIYRLVGSDKDCYSSRELVALRSAQQKRNRGILSQMVATNEEGQEYSLAELSDLSISNPYIKRSELMTRIRGFEEVAESLGHVGVFVTLTCPSAFHPTRTIKGSKKKIVLSNPKYNGSTVRESQAWLSKTWAQLRAKLSRDDIKPYGFRVCEPHADGTPHWHFLLFLGRDLVEDLRAGFWRYALRTHEDERGAKNVRVDFKVIDGDLGTAAGYIAKYVAKNIDGSHIDTDLFGNPAKGAARSIQAFSAGYGVRQFQQIGGAPVTVWRELRRLDGEECKGIENLVEAATASNWAAYTLLMGGVNCSRDARPISVGYWNEVDTDTGEVLGAVDKYGCIAKGSIFGLVSASRSYLTRIHRWAVNVVQRVESAVIDAPLSMAGMEFLHKAKIVLLSDDDLDLLRGDGSLSAA